MMIPDNLQINHLVIAKWENSANKSLRGYKFAMWSYWITKLIAVKELTGYISPELTKFYSLVRSNKN